MELFRKLFMDGDWQIAYRRKQETLIDYNTSFLTVDNTKNYWFADPMIIIENDTVFLFCEAYDRKKEKGVLGYFELEDGCFNNFKLAIEEKHHLSYPCVFKYENQYYMVPESGENKTLDLYVATHFPDEWEKIATLLKGERVVDPTVFKYNDKYYIYIYMEESSYQACIYELDIENKKISWLKNIDYDFNEGRGAGYVFKFNDRLIRPTQDCKKIYGKSVIFREVSLDQYLDEGIIDEIVVNAVSVGHEGRVDRIHTYSRNGDYEAIDFCRLKFDLFKRFKILKRKKHLEKRK